MYLWVCVIVAIKSRRPEATRVIGRISHCHLTVTYVSAVWAVQATIRPLKSMESFDKDAAVLFIA